MIKEFFEIEATQKNTLLMFLGLFLMSFLQLYIFKKGILNDNFYIVILLSLSLALCLTILNLIPIFIIISITLYREKIVFYDRLIFSTGVLVIGGQVLLTYLGYKKHLKFEDFIDYNAAKTLITYLIIFGICALFEGKNIWVRLTKEKK